MKIQSCVHHRGGDMHHMAVDPTCRSPSQSSGNLALQELSYQGMIQLTICSRTTKRMSLLIQVAHRVHVLTILWRIAAAQRKSLPKCRTSSMRDSHNSSSLSKSQISQSLPRMESRSQLLLRTPASRTTSQDCLKMSARMDHEFQVQASWAKVRSNIWRYKRI